MAWSNSVAITIDHTKVPNTDQANFPLLFTGVYPQLATTANGGTATNDFGFDIIFASDSAGAFPLTFERLAYARQTGACEFWVKIPTLSHTSDTVIYILFGNAAITTDQQNASGVWDSNFKGVYHLQSMAGVIVADSTSNTNSGVTGNGGTPLPSVASGKFGKGGASFNGSQAVYLPSMALSACTISAWAYLTSSSYRSILGSISGGVEFRVESGSNVLGFLKENTAGMGNSSTAVSLAAWSHVAVTYDGATVRFYVNGAAAGTSAATQTFAAGNYQIGAAANGENWVGNLDELHLSTSIRSADWLAAEYNNQNSPSTFYATSLTTSSPSNPWGPFPIAENIAAPLIGLAGANHQPVKGPAAIAYTPSTYTPVPVASQLKGGTTGTAYSETITAQGGTAPYSFAVTSGTLPTGCTLASGGAISGTPSAIGTFSFTVTVTDASAFTGSQAFSIAIASPSSGGVGGSYTYLA